MTGFVTALSVSCVIVLAVLTIVVLGVGAKLDVKRVQLRHGHSVTCVQVRGLWSQPISCDWVHAR